MDYPLGSQTLNEEGPVGLKSRLPSKAAVRDAIVENSSGFPRLDAAAIDYAKTNWRYKFTDKDGQLMPAAVRVNVTFDMP